MFDKHFVGGFCGGITGTIAAYPLDTVKVRLQSGCIQVQPPTLREIIKVSFLTSDKFRHLFRGIASPLVTLAPSNALAFYVENRTMNYLQEESIKNHIVSGMVSGIGQALINGPTELVKIQMQVHETAFKNSFSCARQIVAEHGILKLSRGVTVTLCREVPAFGCYFGSYDVIVRDLLKYSGGDGIFDRIKPFIAGGFAGMISWYATYPIDCMKTRIQASGVTEEVSLRKTWLDLRREGEMMNDMCLRSAGMRATLIRAFISNGFTFGTVALVLSLWDTFH